MNRYRLLLACLPILALAGVAVVSWRSKSRPEKESSAEVRLFEMLRSSGMIRHPDLPFTLSARELRGRKLIDVVLKRHNAQGEPDLVICARQAELTVDPTEGRLVVHLIGGHGLKSDGSRTRFADHICKLPLPETVFQ